MKPNRAPVVVIGSGPSGAMAAHVLAKRGLNTIIFEAGRRQVGLLAKVGGKTVMRIKTPLNQADSFTSATGATWYSNCGLGGLSNQWTGAVPRYSPEDFSDTSRLGDEFEWPISYAELAPSYAECERFLGVFGTTEAFPMLPPSVLRQDVALPKAWHGVAALAKSNGGAFCPMPLAGVFRSGITRRSTPFNSYDCVVRSGATSQLMEVRANQRIVRIETDPVTGRATAVVARDDSTGSLVEQQATAVVLAAGAVGTPLLMLRSDGGRHPGGLGNGEGLVGRYLHDHVQHHVTFELGKAMPRLAHVAYFGRAPYDQQEPLCGGQATVGSRFSNLDRLLTLLPTKSNVVGAVIFATARPRPESRVTVNSAGEADINIWFYPHEVGAAHDCERRLSELLQRAGLSPQLLSSQRDHIPGSAVHYAGTARMHRNRALGVVDSWNRVWSSPNVVVADASVFTASSEKNPTLTAMALAARAADHLADELL